MISEIIRDLKRKQAKEIGRTYNENFIHFANMKGTKKEWINYLGISAYEWNKKFNEGFEEDAVIEHFLEIANARREKRQAWEEKLDDRSKPNFG